MEIIIITTKNVKRKKNVREDKIGEKENKNYSMVGMSYKSPLNIIYSKENSIKLDNITNNFMNLIKNNNAIAKYALKKIKTDLHKIKLSVSEKNKTFKHKRTPTMTTNMNSNIINKNNVNNNIRELIIKQQYKKINENKIKRKNILSQNSYRCLYP